MSTTRTAEAARPQGRVLGEVAANALREHRRLADEARAALRQAEGRLAKIHAVLSAADPSLAGYADDGLAQEIVRSLAMNHSLVDSLTRRNGEQAEQIRSLEFQADTQRIEREYAEDDFKIELNARDLRIEQLRGLLRDALGENPKENA